jgi:hypothetical protein
VIEKSDDRCPKFHDRGCFSKQTATLRSIHERRWAVTIAPIRVPDEWDDNGIILFEEFCAFIRTPQCTVRDWRRCGRGPTWHRFNGNGRLYVTVAELRRFLRGDR